MFGKKTNRIAELEAALVRTEELLAKREGQLRELREGHAVLTERVTKYARRHAELKDYAHHHNGALAREALGLLRGSPQFRGTCGPEAPSYSWTDVEQGMRRIAAELEA